jgi:hypothetical protein
MDKAQRNKLSRETGCSDRNILGEGVDEMIDGTGDAIAHCSDFQGRDEATRSSLISFRKLGKVVNI